MRTRSTWPEASGDGLGEAVEVAVLVLEGADGAVGDGGCGGLEEGDALADRARQEKGVDRGPGQDEDRAENPAARREPDAHQGDECQSNRHPDEERKEETTGHGLSLR